MYRTLCHRALLCAATLVAAMVPLRGAAQEGWNEVFNKLKLEARADFDACGTSDDGGDPLRYGFHGKYFNLMMGGNLGSGFSYYYRQRIIARPGSVGFFDNTDFLYLDYRPNAHWRLRLGKDAMAVGGYEYDAPPIDEYMVSEYWNNFYCFQLGASAAYTTDDGRHTVVAQVTQSPYIQSLGLDWDAGLLAYSVEWMGSIGEHVRTLWSTSMIERQRHRTEGKYMNLTMLGTQIVYDRWSLYVDLMHHALAADDWGNNYGWVVRYDYHFSPSWTLFAKHSHEDNHSEVDMASAEWIDQLVPAGHSFTKFGLGFEFRPAGLQSVRLHGYVATLADMGNTCTPDYSLCGNIGFTWTMDFHKLLKK